MSRKVWKMTELYTSEGIAGRRKRAGRARTAAWIISIVTLGAAAALCMGVRTANALIRQWAAIDTLIAGGAAVLLLLETVVIPETREARHEEGVLRERGEDLRGSVVSIGPVFHIPKNIAFVPVGIKGEQGTEQVRLNACWQKDFPPVGTEIRIRTARKYITAADPRPGEKLPPAETGLRAGRKFRRVWQLATHVLALALACALLVSWFFNQLTDTDRIHKVTLFAEVSAMAERDFAAYLEQDLPEGIRMVTAHPFHYAMLDTVSLETADLYLMTGEGAREHGTWLVPLPESMREGELLTVDGTAVGVLIYRAGEESELEKYLPALREEGKNLYLCFGAGGYHISTLPGARDDASLSVAEALKKLKQ